MQIKTKSMKAKSFNGIQVVMILLCKEARLPAGKGRFRQTLLYNSWTLPSFLNSEIRHSFVIRDIRHITVYTMVGGKLTLLLRHIRILKTRDWWCSLISRISNDHRITNGRWTEDGRRMIESQLGHQRIKTIQFGIPDRMNLSAKPKFQYDWGHQQRRW